MTIKTLVDFLNHPFRYSAKDAWRARIHWRAKVPGPLHTELENLRKNIRRDEQTLDEMTIDVGDCCHSCVYGNRYNDLMDLLERRVERVRQIQWKLWYDAGNYGPVRLFTTDHCW